MAERRAVEDLLGTWDGLIGTPLLGDEGVIGLDGYWSRQVTAILDSAFSSLGDMTEGKTQAATAALVALDLYQPDELGRLAPGSTDAELVRSIFVKYGLDDREASVLAAALAIIASHWNAHSSTVRPTVRTALLRARRAVEELVPTQELSAVGMGNAAVVARKWAASILGGPEWSDDAKEFMAKFGVTESDVAGFADALDRSVERIDLVLGIFMDAYCRGCNPRERPVCVQEANAIGVEVRCPLLARRG